MLTSHFKLRQLFADFWLQKKHKEVPPIPLVPKDDPTTLFTGSGMQQLVPYLLGETHPLGNRLYNIQRCIRAQDIEEVGDNRHDTFFEMMGNWSLGDYFKAEQLEWFWYFLTSVLDLPKDKLYVSVFKGTDDIPADQVSYQVWKKLGVIDNHIYKYGPEKNWWSRVGKPSIMPAGEPGGPDSEVFFDFGEELLLHEKSRYKNEKCHPNCDCGRFIEIGNSVFMQYKKVPNGTFEELPKKNVDFGGGLERLIMAIENKNDLFHTQLFFPLIETLEEESGKSYRNYEQPMRIVADHVKTAVFMANEDIEPSNKEQGYIMRRLIRRSVVCFKELEIPPEKIILKLIQTIINIYKPVYFKDNSLVKIHLVISNEIKSFLKTLDKGVKQLQGLKEINGVFLFNLKQSYGFPIEIALELWKKWGKACDEKKLKQEFNEEFIKHQKLSRQSSTAKFRGGLADQSQQTLKYHTATHLLHQALFNILGNTVRQEGSNITGERLRFDFFAIKKPTDDDIKKVESLINEKIKEELLVSCKILPKNEAKQIGAKSFFKEKYPDMVKVYFIGDFSKEFCGGPHVKNTKEIGVIKIFKFEKIGNSLYRLYAK